MQEGGCQKGFYSRCIFFFFFSFWDVSIHRQGRTGADYITEHGVDFNSLSISTMGIVMEMYMPCKYAGQIGEMNILLT